MDIRWQQRFSNYTKAYNSLSEFIATGELNKFEKQGLIHVFEYTYELAWKTLKDFLEYDGYKNIGGPKSVIKTAFKVGIIDNGEAWADMHLKRNLTSHTYNEKTAIEIVFYIKNTYYQLFRELKIKLDSKKLNNTNGLPFQKIESFINILSKNEKIEEVLLFGSRAIGNFKTGSDIDLAIKGEDIDINLVSSLIAKTEDLWFPYTLDIIIYKQINEPALTQHINRVGISIYKKTQ